MRAKVFHIEFLEHHQPVWTKMSYQTTDGSDWIRVVHQYKPADDRIELLTELHFRRVALEKIHIVDLLGPDARRCPGNSCFRAIDSNHSALSTYKVRRQKGYISSARAYVENVHARANSSLVKKLASERQEYSALATETREFVVGMSQGVTRLLHRFRAHRDFCES